MKRRFTNTICLGDWDFLAHVAAETRSKGAEHTTAVESEVVFHLLRRIKMEFKVERENLIGIVEARLRPHVPHLDDESGVRERLVGTLMERLGNGEVKLDRNAVDTMLRDAGLSPDRVRKARRLARKLERGIRHSSGYLKYRRERDVRGVPSWPTKKPVLLISGDSGTGKSWQLARLMEEGAGKGESFVFVRADGSAADMILRRAAEEIWQVALGHTYEMTLQGISNFFREPAFKMRPPLYTIAVDDVRSVDLARSLVGRDWTSLGARLAMTVSSTHARMFELENGEAIHLHRVGDFAVDELDSLLKMDGHRWRDLPPDLKRLLRKPVLARPLCGSGYRVVPGCAAERVRNI